ETRPGGRSHTRRARRSASTSTPAAARRAASYRLSDPRADDGLDDAALPELVARDLVDDHAARHHDDAVAEAGELERVAGLDEHRDPLPGLRAQRVVDVEARPDVDALRRLLGEDHLHAPTQERPGQRDLLLVPTGERLHGLLDRRHADPQPARERVDALPLPPAPEEAEAAEAPEDLDRRVRPHAQHGKERFARAVAAQQDDAGAKRPERRAEVERRAVARRVAGGELRAGERAQELHLAVPLGAGDADDLTRADLEVDRPEPFAPQAVDREEHLALGTRGPLRERELQRAPDHQRDERVLGHGRGLEGALADAVAEHGEPV